MLSLNPPVADRGLDFDALYAPLLQMDGLSQSDEMVFVLAATNLPWELDTAMLRRLEKRILVPLPGGEARLRMLQHLLPPEKYTGLDFEETVEKMAGYSGSDVRLVCKEAAMRPLRRLMSALDEEEGSSSDVSAGDVLFDLRAPFLFVDFRSCFLVWGKEHLCFCSSMRPMSGTGTAVLGCGRKYTEVAVAGSVCFDLLSCFAVKRWGKRGLAFAKTNVPLGSSSDTSADDLFLFSAVRCLSRFCA